MGFFSFLGVGAKLASRAREKVFDENWRASDIAVLDSVITPNVISNQKTYLDLIDGNLNAMEACLKQGNFNEYESEISKLVENVKLNRVAANFGFVSKDDLKYSVFQFLRRR